MDSSQRTNDEEEEHLPQHSENEYLFRGAAFHPVQEYYVDVETEGHTESIPDFVLEVTWPRVALFYHPSSHYSVDIQQKYIHLARQIRHSSARIPVEFWALSCEAYQNSCADLEINSVPTLMGFPMGEIKGTHIKRTKDNNIVVDDVLRAIDITLEIKKKTVVTDKDDGNAQEEVISEEMYDGESEHQEAAAFEESATIPKEQGGGDQERPMQHMENQPDENIRAILHPHASLPDVFADAVASFLFSLDQSVRNLNASSSSWTSRKQHLALREFLDFLHWTLPSRDMAGLHNLVNDLRNNIHSIIQDPQTILDILTSHEYYNHPELFQTWSSSCSQQRHDGGYACGLWKLLHVISIGVTKQHSKVMGDLDRVRVSHCLQIIRDYLVEIGFQNDKRSQQFIMESYDTCLEDEQCRQDLGIQPKSWFFLRKHPIPPPTDPTWHNLSLWLWQVHNAYRITGEGGRNNGESHEHHPRYESLLHKEEIQWPPQDLCPKCYSESIPLLMTGNEERGGAQENGIDTTSLAGNHNDLYVDRIGNVWDKNEVLKLLTAIYWPKSIQNPRLVVLDRWDNRKFLFRKQTESGEIVRHWLEVMGLVGILLVGIFFWYPQWKLQKSGQHKKKDADNMIYGIDDYLTEAVPQKQQEQKLTSMKRSTRHRGSSSSETHGGSKHRSIARARVFLDD